MDFTDSTTHVTLVEEEEGKKKNTSLLNRSHVKAAILSMFEEHRAGQKKFTRVGAECYKFLEIRLRQIIEDQVKRHPSIGKTVKFQ
jgi:hypothetical protein